MMRVATEHRKKPNRPQAPAPIKLPKSASARINHMWSDDETITPQDLRDRRDMAVRDGDMRLALLCAIALDKKLGRY